MNEPDRIGPYEILGVLGRGGMGVVYRGRHVETGELAAVKTVRVSLAGLTEPAVASIVGDMLALSPAPGALSGHLARQSLGNPFFVAEYLRAAVDEGMLWRDGAGCWRVSERGEGGELLARAEEIARALNAGPSSEVA